MVRKVVEAVLRWFWGDSSIINYLLLPFSSLYLIGYYLKKTFTTAYKVNVFVICVGNLCVGGAGKTSFCISLAKKLRDEGHKGIAFISKGYGRKSRGKSAFRVHYGMDPLVCGDEPLLLSEHGSVYVGDTRLAAIKLAVEDGAKIVILDDGLQDYSIVKDYSFCLMTEANGNGLPLPAGPMRELKCFAKSKVDQFVYEDNLTAHYSLEKPLVAPKYVAFCALGNPNAFKRALGEVNAEIAAFHAFPDHHIYTDEDLQMLKNYNMPLLTTKKDYVKLPSHFTENVYVVNKDVEISELPKALKEKLFIV